MKLKQVAQQFSSAICKDHAVRLRNALQACRKIARLADDCLLTDRSGLERSRPLLRVVVDSDRGVSLDDAAALYKASALAPEDRLVNIFTVPEKNGENGEYFIFSVSRQGMVKKSAVSELPGPSAQRFTLVRINNEDELLTAIRHGLERDRIRCRSRKKKCGSGSYRLDFGSHQVSPRSRSSSSDC